MKLLIVRHGEPDYAVDSLTEKGRREAALLADRLCALPIEHFYVSPLGRARATAEYTLKRLGRQAETLDWLEEFRGRVVDPCTGEKSIAWDFAPQYWTRCPELWDPEAWRENALIRTGNSAAIYDETVRGLDALLLKHGYRREGHLYLAEKNTDKTICLFCHFGVGMAMLSHLIGIPFYPAIHGFIMAPSTVTTFVTEERVPGQVWFRCTGLGDASHLYAGNEPLSQFGRYRERYGVDEGMGAKE